MEDERKPQGESKGSNKALNLFTVDRLFIDYLLLFHRIPQPPKPAKKLRLIFAWPKVLWKYFFLDSRIIPPEAKDIKIDNQKVTTLSQPPTSSIHFLHDEGEAASGQGVMMPHPIKTPGKIKTNGCDYWIGAVIRQYLSNLMFLSTGEHREASWDTNAFLLHPKWKYQNARTGDRSNFSVNFGRPLLRFYQPTLRCMS